MLHVGVCIRLTCQYRQSQKFAVSTYDWKSAKQRLLPPAMLRYYFVSSINTCEMKLVVFQSKFKSNQTNNRPTNKQTSKQKHTLFMTSDPSSLKYPTVKEGEIKFLKQKDTLFAM